MATTPKKPSNSIRVDTSTHQKLRRLSYDLNTPIKELIEQAVDSLYDESVNDVKTIPLDDLSAIIRKRYPNIIIVEKLINPEPTPLPEWLE